MKKFVFYLILAGLLYGTLELMALGALLVIGQVKKTSYKPILTSSLSDDHRRRLSSLIRGETGYIAFSPDLGWTIKPSGSAPLYRANSQGFRADRDYTPVPAKGIVRIAAFGDSFTHGAQVGNGDTWESHLEKTSPGLEVLNFGVDGFGVDQAFLRYRREGVGFNPQIVLIGFMTTNVNRHINTFRPFTVPKAKAPFAKPRFKITNNTLVPIENPIRDLSGYRELLERPEKVLPRLGVHDYYYSFRYRKLPMDFLPSVRAINMAAFAARMYLSEHTYKNEFFNVKSEAFVLTVKIFEEFVKTVKDNKSVPLILLFPRQYDVRRYRREKTKMYAPLRIHLEKAGYDFVDLMDAFEGRGREFSIEELFVGHYSPLGNRIVAEHLAQALRERSLIR